jgi:hypothetical protein
MSCRPTESKDTLVVSPCAEKELEFARCELVWDEREVLLPIVNQLPNGLNLLCLDLALNGILYGCMPASLAMMLETPRSNPEGPV